MTQAPAPPRATRRQHDREIVALAVPAFGALVAPIIKLFIPQTGMWIGPHEFVLAGVPGDPQSARELAGANFVYLMVLVAFLSGTVTTFLLRKMIRSREHAKAIERHPVSPRS